MAALWRTVGNLYSAVIGNGSKLALNVCRSQSSNQATTTCYPTHKDVAGWANWRMLKDHRRRMIVKENALLRRRISCLRKNQILPKALQEIAHQEIHALPRDTNRHRVTNRCSVTSRPRGIVRRWRVSRIIFRHLADYNYLSGCIRAHWG
ncbi:28S ribosomal protein S14, mitochondrial [Chamberlinius hualienensis]